ncbi:MAG: 2'-5' RNA ligase family protein, partial [Actinobacteria bacterium]|nr:2'-5' RNA ligase family protein [Actinomycetota bacterium]
MSRARLGVAVLFDAETTAEIDGLRRALGEPDLGKIAPHLTLVPPVNVRDVGQAMAVVRTAAHSVRPFAVELGPIETFLPDNPVAYLAGGGDVAAVHRLRGGVFQPPLARDLSWPYVPHVTVADGIDPEVIAAAPHVLGAYRRDVTVTAVRLLEERDRRW